MAVRDWKIRISNYGTYDFRGTEAEAEEERKRKARHEGEMSAKYPANPETVVEKLHELREWFFAHEGACPGWVLTQIRKYKKLETSPTPTGGVND